MGFHRGQLIVYNIYRMEVPVARHEVCRAKILKIREILPFKMHLVYDETNLITLCQLTGTGTRIIHQFNLFRKLFDIIVQGTFIYMAYEAGDIDFFEVVNLEELHTKRQLTKRRSSKYIEEMNPSALRNIRRNQVEATTHSIIRYNLPKKHDSDDGITAFTISPSSGCLASADRTGLIKIWSPQKQLLREI